MTKENAIKNLQQIYTEGGHCWLDEQKKEAINMAIDSLQEETKPKFKVGDRIKFKGIHNEDVVRVITDIKEGKGGGFRYFFADGSIHSISYNEIELVEEPVSEELEEVAKRYATEGDEISGLYIIDEEVEAFKAGAKWKEEQFEKNRLAACDRQTEEEADTECDFVTGIIKKEHRLPTYDDAIKYGRKIQKEQMKVVFVITRCEKHSDYVEEVFLDESKAKEYCKHFEGNEDAYARHITKIKLTL